MKKRASEIRSFSQKSRKGASHLAFVLSLVIFIMFIIFMFSAIEPFLKTQASKQSLLDFLRFSLVDNFKSDDLTTMTITVSPTGREHACIKITGGTAQAFFDQIGENNNLRIKDESGSLVEYDFTGNAGSGNQLLIEIPEGYEGILKIYYSSGIDSSRGDLKNAGCDNVDATIDSIKTESQTLQSNVNSLKERYDLDCGETIKTELGIPRGSEFTFLFELANGLEIKPREECENIPDTNIYATRFPVQYLDNDANFQIGFLTIKVW